MTSFVFHGLEEFKVGVDRLVAHVEVATRSAVTEAAHVIEAGAKQRSPVRTGTLRRSVMVDGPKHEGLGVYSARVGPTVVYGRRIELGFHGQDKLGRVYNQSGNPYLRPAYEHTAGSLSDVFARNWATAMKA